MLVDTAFWVSLFGEAEKRHRRPSDSELLYSSVLKDEAPFPGNRTQLQCGKAQ